MWEIGSVENQPTTEGATKTGLNKGAVAKFGSGAALSAVFVIFAVQNAATVDVEFLAWNFSMRRILLILCSAAFGILVWELTRVFWRRRRRSG